MESESVNARPSAALHSTSRSARFSDLPRRLAIFKAQRQGLSAFDHFSRQSELVRALLDLRTRDFNSIVGFEAHSDQVQKAFRAQKNFSSGGIAFQHEINYRFPARWRNKPQLLHHAFESGFCRG